MKSSYIRSLVVCINILLTVTLLEAKEDNGKMYMGLYNSLQQNENNQIHSYNNISFISENLPQSQSNVQSISAPYIHEHDKEDYLTVSFVGTISFMFIGVAVLYALPSSITNWEKQGLKEDIHNIGSEWVDNVTSPPVVDKDGATLNYILHPYWGAIYYMQGRNAGYGYFGSFMTSFVASTFLWEYGVEAFAESPSVQDLIITPVLGSLLGELFYQTSLNIKQNNCEVLDSKVLGYTLLTLMDPGFLIIENTRLHKYVEKNDIPASSSMSYPSNQYQQYSGWVVTKDSLMLRLSIAI